MLRRMKRGVCLLLAVLLVVGLVPGAVFAVEESTTELDTALMAVDAVLATIGIGQIYEFRNHSDRNERITFSGNNAFRGDYLTYDGRGNTTNLRWRARRMPEGRYAAVIPAGGKILIEHRFGGSLTVNGNSSVIEARRLITPIFHVEILGEGDTLEFYNRSGGSRAVSWTAAGYPNHPSGTNVSMRRTTHFADGRVSGPTNVDSVSSGINLDSGSRIVLEGVVSQQGNRRSVEISMDITAFTNRPYRLTACGQRSFPPGAAETPPPQPPTPSQITLEFYSRLHTRINNRDRYGYFDNARSLRGVSISFNSSVFRGNARTYNHDLAIVSAILSESAYCRNRVQRNLRTLGFTIISPPFYDRHGITDTAYIFAHNPDTNVVAVIVRGTADGILREWPGNLSPHLLRVSGARVQGHLLRWLNEIDGINRNDVRIWITGHSRGAAVANYMGHSLTQPLVGQFSQERVFVYTFGGPRIAPLARANRDNIFNFANLHDPTVHFFPAMQKYGQTTTFELSSVGRAQFASLTGEQYRGLNPRHSHTLEAYLALLLTNSQRPESLRFRARSIIIKCPVDVDVFDSSGRLVGRVVNGAVDTSLEEMIAIWIDEENDTKHFSLPLEGEFIFRMIGTDTGILNLTAAYVDFEDWTVHNQRVFQNVTLYAGREMTATVAEGAAVAQARIFLVEDGEVVAEIATDGTETPITSLPFTDVNPNDWFYAAVRHVFEQDIMHGTSATAFSPHSSLNRAMVATILSRLGNNSATFRPIFHDVSSGQWYSGPITWAHDRGVVTGMPDGSFAPGRNIPTEQLAVMIHRYAESRGFNLSVPGHVSAPAGTSDWAVEAMGWAIHNGFLRNQSPHAAATRAETAYFVYRFSVRYGI